MSLELKHIAAYLPYKVKALMVCDTPNIVSEITGIEITNFGIDILYGEFGASNINNCQLVLRPMSELTFEKLVDIGINSKTAIRILNYILLGKTDFEKILKYHQIEKLLSEHYDLFNLIPQGLAIPINDVGVK